MATKATKSSKCAYCGGTVSKDADHRPFCSARCKQLDLGKWLSEDYRIETEEPVDPETLEQMLENGNVMPFPQKRG